MNFRGTRRLPSEIAGAPDPPMALPKIRWATIFDGGPARNFRGAIPTRLYTCFSQGHRSEIGARRIFFTDPFMAREKKRGSPQHVISWGEAERPNSSNLDVRLRHKWLGKKSSPKESKGDKRSGAQGGDFIRETSVSYDSGSPQIPKESEGTAVLPIPKESERKTRCFSRAGSPKIACGAPRHNGGAEDLRRTKVNRSAKTSPPCSRYVSRPSFAISGYPLSSKLHTI